MLKMTTDFASHQTEAAIDKAVTQLARNLENGGHHRAGDEALLVTLVLTSRVMTIAAADSQVGSTRSTSTPTQGAGTIVVRLQRLEELVGIDEGSGTETHYLESDQDFADPIPHRVSRLETEIKQVSKGCCCV